MKEFLYLPSYLAVIVCELNLSVKVTSDLLNAIWENDKPYLLAEHQVNKKKFIKDVMYEINYNYNSKEMELEKAVIRDDLKSIGGDICDEKNQRFDYVSIKFIEMRLKILYLGNNDYVRMKLRTFLDYYGYKRRNANLINFIHKCLYFYHIETFLKGNEKCNIESIKLDDMIIFRVLENRRKVQELMISDAE